MIFKSNLKKGNVLAVCNEVVRNFAVLRRQNPEEQEYILCGKLWSFWYMQNHERIWRDYCDEQAERLEELRIERSTPKFDDEIFKIFSDFLVLETAIDMNQYKEYVKAIKLLYKTMKKANLTTKSSQKEVLKEIKLYK
jgi:hypothetical protein